MSGNRQKKGYAFIFNQGSISWSSKKENVVALSPPWRLNTSNLQHR